MRRISAACAKSGQVLGYAVYDNYGTRLINEQTLLDDRNISLALNNDVAELFIEDPFASDVPAAPLISPEIEGKAAFTLRKVLNENNGRTNISIRNVNELKDSADAMAEALMQNSTGEIAVPPVTREKDYIYLQPVKTAVLSLALGISLNLSRTQLSILALASLCKDIGYIEISREIIMKAGALSSAETLKIREHCKLGYDILNQHAYCRGDIAAAVLQHHERWNGKGYPLKLKHDNISLYAQIIAITDQYASLLSRRPGGRKLYLPHEAVEYVMAFSGEYLNPEIVKIFVKMVSCYSSGLMVKINTGEVGIVSDPKTGFIGRPVVRVCDGPAITVPQEIDLTKFEHREKMIAGTLDYSF